MRASRFLDVLIVPHAVCGCHWQSHVYKVSGYTRAENSNLHWLAEVQRNTRLLIEFHTRPCSWIYIIYRWSNRDHVIMSHFTILMSTFSTLYHTLPHFTTLYHTFPHFITLYHTLPHFSTFYHILPHFTTLYHTLPHFTTFYHILPHFTTLFHILPHFTTFYHTLPHFTMK